MRLKHKDNEKYGEKVSTVSVQYDGRTHDLTVDELGAVHVSNEKQRNALLEDHGGFVEDPDAEQDELNSYVLADLNVSEVGDYVENINDVDRLVELRELEVDRQNRKTAVEQIDNRIGKLRDDEDGA